MDLTVRWAKWPLFSCRLMPLEVLTHALQYGQDRWCLPAIGADLPNPGSTLNKICRHVFQLSVYLGCWICQLTCPCTSSGLMQLIQVSAIQRQDVSLLLQLQAGSQQMMPHEGLFCMQGLPACARMALCLLLVCVGRRHLTQCQLQAQCCPQKAAVASTAGSTLEQIH